MLLILIHFFPNHPFYSNSKAKNFVYCSETDSILYCQYQFTTQKEAQQEEVSQVERPAKHSKIAYICKMQFCWNSHDNALE